MYKYALCTIILYVVVYLDKSNLVKEAYVTRILGSKSSWPVHRRCRNPSATIYMRAKGLVWP